MTTPFQNSVFNPNSELYAKAGDLRSVSGAGSGDPRTAGSSENPRTIGGDLRTNGGNVRAPKNDFRLVCYSEVEKRPTKWLWPGWIAAGKVTLLVGEKGLGKSLIAADLAARVSRSRPWPDQEIPRDEDSSPADDASSKEIREGGWSIVLCGDHERREEMPDRLMAAGANLDLVCTNEPDCDLPDFAETPSMNSQLKSLEWAIVTLLKCKLVVIDSLAAMLEGEKARGGLTTQELIRTLASFAKKYRVAIVVVADLNLRASARSVDRMTSVFRAASSATRVLGVFRDPSEPGRRVLLPLDSNFSEERAALSFRMVASNGQDVESDRLEQRHPHPGPLPEGEGVGLRVEWGEKVTTSLEKLLGGSRFNGVEQKYRDDESFSTTQLRELLSDGPIDRSLLRLKFTGSDDQLYRAADRVGAIKEKTEFNGGWRWMLPEHHAAWLVQEAERKKQAAAERQERKTRNQRMSRAERRAARREERQREFQQASGSADFFQEGAEANKQRESRVVGSVGAGSENVDVSLRETNCFTRNEKPTLPKKQIHASVQPCTKAREEPPLPLQAFNFTPRGDGYSDASRQGLVQLLNMPDAEFYREVEQAEARNRKAGNGNELLGKGRRVDSS